MLVKSGQTTPQQALQQVVQQLASELTDQQFSLLLEEIEFKRSRGSLSGAKQLLLESLCTVRHSQTNRNLQDAFDQQQDVRHKGPSSNSSKHSTAGVVSPAFWHTSQQQQQKDCVKTSTFAAAAAAAATSGRDISPGRDQGQCSTPQHAPVKQQHSQQQQQQQDPLVFAHTSDQAAAGGSKLKAFAARQGLGPLQLH